MPATYNGIGTHYYGKGNLTTRQAVCPHCHRAVHLTSYDTRLWFVVLFLPIIPLGRKRIVDQCPSCRRHYVVDKQKWETAKQLEISGAEETYRRDPTPEHAVAVHQQLVRFHETVRAEEFQKELAEKYADHAKVQVYLAAALQHLGRHEQAASFYQRALALRPDLPEARLGVSEGHLRAGRLDEARKLIDFLEKPGAAQLYSLRPLEVLAIAYQKAGRHQEALDLFGRLLAELPKIAEVNVFRNLVSKSEKALSRTSSLLPKRSFSFRRLFSLDPGKRAFAASGAGKRKLVAVGVVLALVALGMLVSNEYIRRHRTVYLLNGYGQPASVRIAGVAPIPSLRGFAQVELAEGNYRVSIAGPVRQELDLKIGSGYFSRWGSKPVWIINVGGSAILLFEKVTYGRAGERPRYSFHFGQPIEFFTDVDYPFTDLPETIQLHSGEKRVLSHLQVFHGGSEVVFEQLNREGRPNDGLRFAETYLSSHPSDSKLVDLYASECTKLRQTEQLERYLEAGLTNRPVAIEWHRWYQRQHAAARELPSLIARYENYLRVEPDNSALLYLRGRIEPDRAAQKTFFNHSAERDPRNPYPFYALGYDAMSAGDWLAARTHLTQAAKDAPEDYTFSQALFVSRLALGEAPALEKEVRAQLRHNPLQVPLELQLVQSLVAEGLGQEALRESSNFERQFLAKHGRAARLATDLVQREALYAVGDFAGLENSARQDFSASGRSSLLVALIEQGRITEAQALRAPVESSDDQPFWLLALSMAAFQYGDTNSAAQWRSQATAIMCGAGLEVAGCVPLLSHATAPMSAEIQSMALPPEAKAILLATLSQLHPGAAELETAARRFNVVRRFPYHLIQRVTAVAAPPVEAQ